MKFPFCRQRPGAKAAFESLGASSREGMGAEAATPSTRPTLPRYPTAGQVGKRHYVGRE